MINRIHSILQRPILYLKEKLPSSQFFVLSSILVGLTSGLAAVTLKYFVHSIERLVTYYSNAFEEFLVFALFPLVGILLTVMYLRYFLKSDIQKGTAEIVHSIVKKSSKMPPETMYSHLITSGLTVGFGGSMGLESPMVTTGAAIGSNYGRAYSLSYKDRTILLACGAAAGIGAAFNSPIAGVLFAVEVFTDRHQRRSTDSAHHLSCLRCPAFQNYFTGRRTYFFYPPAAVQLLQRSLLHITGSFRRVSFLLYYARMFTWVDLKMKAVSNIWVRVLLGGTLLFILLIFFPPLFGEGYESIKSLSLLQPSCLQK